MKSIYYRLFATAILSIFLLVSCHENEIYLEPLASISLNIPATKTDQFMPESFEAVVGVSSNGKDKKSTQITFSRMEEWSMNYRANNAFEVPINTPVVIFVEADINGIEWRGESDQVILSPANAPFLIVIDLRQGVQIIEGEGVTDIDGNDYETVIIGLQEWMASNLQVTQFSNGEPITLAEQNQFWQNAANSRAPAYSWYNNNETNAEDHGALYNWYSVETGLLCPDGWRVPTDDDWFELTDNLGSVAGRQLKAETGWGAGGGSDIYGFKAMGSGYRHHNGEFGGMQQHGFWWSSTPATAFSAWGRNITSSGSTVNRFSYGNEYGFSVRCVKTVEKMTPTIWLEEEVWDLTDRTAFVWGYVLDEGASPITQLGIVWSTTPNPTRENNQGMQVYEDDWFEEFFFDLFNLTPGQTYYVRAFAENGHGLDYSNQISFTTFEE